MTKQRIVGYVRVSTEEQAQNGVSLEDQCGRIVAYAKAHGHALVTIERDEGLSGATPPADRPGLSRALAMVRSGQADALAFTDLTRLSRSTRDVLDLADDASTAGWDLVSLKENIDTTSAAGRMFLSMLAVFSQFEREQTAERVRAALAHKRSRNERTGQVPYGSTLGADGRTLLEDPKEQQVLKRIRSLRRNGKSLRAVTAYLNEHGFRCRGKRWHLTTVARLAKKLEAA